MPQLILIVAMFALLWLFLIRPQRARAQAHRELLTRVNIGDEILTVGGLYGNVIEIDEDDDLMLEIAPGTQVRIARRAVAAVVPPEERREERRRARGGRSRGTGRGSPQLTYSAASVNRRPHLTLVALIAAGLIGVGLLADSRIADRADADARARPPGRSRGDAEGRAAAQPAAAEDRPRPLGRDPPQPRRPARRRGARDPQAGQRTRS